MNDEREERVRALLPLVRRIAKRVHRLVRGCDMEDLIGDGCVGLIRAVDAFDPGRGIALDVYARRIILGAMLNGVRRRDPVPERMRRTLRDAEAQRFALAQRLGVLPSTRQMENTVPGLAQARVQAFRRLPLSLDQPLPLGARLAIDDAGDPQQVYGEYAERERVRAAVNGLPPRERAVVLQHYFEEQPLRAIAEPMRISPQRVSQLHLAAMRRLRTALSPVP